MKNEYRNNYCKHLTKVKTTFEKYNLSANVLETFSDEYNIENLHKVITNHLNESYDVREPTIVMSFTCINFIFYYLEELLSGISDEQIEKLKKLNLIKNDKEAIENRDSIIEEIKMDLFCKMKMVLKVIIPSNFYLKNCNANFHFVRNNCSDFYNDNSEVKLNQYWRSKKLIKNRKFDFLYKKMFFPYCDVIGDSFNLNYIKKNDKPVDEDIEAKLKKERLLRWEEFKNSQSRENDKKLSNLKELQATN